MTDNLFIFVTDDERAKTRLQAIANDLSLNLEFTRKEVKGLRR